MDTAKSNARPIHPASLPRRPFSPGDHVVRYLHGQPFFCTVISVEPDQKIRVSCAQWPAGYSALVASHEVIWVSSA